jgi:hypothetical protein
MANIASPPVEVAPGAVSINKTISLNGSIPQTKGIDPFRKA